MKFVLIASLLVCGCSLGDSTHKRLSRAELLERRAASLERSQELVPETRLGEVKHPSQSSILTSSETISSGSHWTYVPKGAIMIKPESYQKRVNSSQKGKFLSFPEFAVKNRGWLTTMDVTLKQARGTEPLNEGKLKALKDSGRVIVTVLKGGAISVRPSPNPDEVVQN